MSAPVTILIVDDAGVNRRLIQALLGPQGYVTRTAASGEEALASITADPPDLILSNHVCQQLPKRPGNARGRPLEIQSGCLADDRDAGFQHAAMALNEICHVRGG